MWGKTLAIVLIIGAGRARARAAQAAPETPRIPAVLDYERDRGLTLAVVDGRKVRLGDVAQHLERYAPDIVERWSDSGGARDLNSRALPQYLYQYADILCLRAEAKQKDLRLADLDARIESKLAAGFDQYLKGIQRARRGQGVPLTPKTTALYRRRHRREQGLRAEIDALLDLLVPPRYTMTQLREWHAEHGDVFGGQVKFAHILFALRDPHTGRLISEAARRRLRARAWDVYERAKKDPGTFAELAREYSDDRVTRARGGEFRAWTGRLNPRLPAALVRAAWELPNGGISQPVESFYGIHVVRRIKHVVNSYILFYGKTIGRVTKMRSKLDQEGFLFAMRKRHAIRLLL